MGKDGTARVSVLHPKSRPPLDESIAAPVTLTAPPQTERERAIMNRPNLQTMLKSGHIIGGNQEMAIGSWVLIVDSEQIFKYLNEPLKSSGECLVVWPDELVQHVSFQGYRRPVRTKMSSFRCLVEHLGCSNHHVEWLEK